MEHRNKQLSIHLVLMIIFFASIILPVSIVTFIVPSYYKQQMTRDTTRLVQSNLGTISDTIIIYLSDLQKLAALPYFNAELRNVFFSDSSSELAQQDYLDLMFGSYLKLLRQEILSIMIVNNQTPIYHYHRNQNYRINEKFQFSDSDWYEKAIAANGNTIYIGAHPAAYYKPINNSLVFSMARLIKHPYIDHSLGVVIVDADIEVFRDVFRDLDYGARSISMLLDNDDNLLYSTQEADSVLLNQIKGKPEMISHDNEQYFVVYHSVPIGEWTIAVLVLSADITERIRLIYYVAIAASVLTFAATYILFRFLTLQFLVRPIKEMSGVMDHAASGDLSVRCHPRGSDEIRSLGNNLNGMIEKLNQLIIKDYKLVISQKQAEFKALQARIKPHFLYNTLNSMIGLNREGNKLKLEEAILNLTSMMRYSLSDDDLGQSTIRNEIDFIRKYCYLQQIRFEEKLSVEIKVKDEINDIPIPKLLIQPLVENAILHNIDKTTNTVHIEIVVDLVGAVICIMIKDNGSGFENLQNADHKGGLRNVRERLSMYYVDSKFLIDSKIGIGTTISLQFPAKGDRIFDG